MQSAGFAAAVAEHFAPTPDYCVMCGASRATVPKLVVIGNKAICSRCVGDALAALRSAVAEKAPSQPRPRAPRGNGYTGDFCSQCGSAAVLRTGTCITCQECGANDGCG